MTRLRLRWLPLLLLLGAAEGRAQVLAHAPFEVRLGFAWVHDSVGSTTFSGTPPQGIPPIQATGAELGFVHPDLWGAEAEATLGLGRWATFAAVGGFGLGQGPDQSPTRPGLAATLAPQAFSEWKLALAPGVHAHLKEIPLELSLEARVGVRDESFPTFVGAFYHPGCVGTDCSDTFSHVQWLLQPWARVGWEMGDGFSLGAFVGMDVAPQPLHQVLAGLDMALSGRGF